MPPPIPAPPITLDDKQKRGRTLLAIIFAVLLAIDIGITIVLGMQKGFDQIFGSLARICFSIGLMYALWTGQRWARWTMVILMFAGALLCLPALISRPHPLFFLMVAVLSGSAFMIGFSKHITSFLLFQRNKK